MGLINRPVIKLYQLELGSTVESEDSQDDVVSEGRPAQKTAIVVPKRERD